MKKLLSILLIFAFLSPYFMPLSIVFAATDEYAVIAIKSNGSVTEVGKYSEYSSAKTAMNNYNSTESDVAAITRNGVLVYVKYGVFRPNADYSTLTFSSDYGSRYISPNYNNDAVFLDYDPSTNKVEFMLSGVRGWTSVENGMIYPISYITDGSNTSFDPNKKYVRILYSGGIRFREGPGTNYNQIGCNGANRCTTAQGGMWATVGAIYEWLNYGNVVSNEGYDWYQVKINGKVGYIANEVATHDLEEYSVNLGTKQDLQTYYYVNGNGELYHQYYIADKYIGYIRIGKAPLYLTSDKIYYSFDGNYFYTSFATMVNDLRNNNHNNAVNKMAYYNYYQYLPTRSRTNYDANNLNSYIGFNSKINRTDFYELRYNEQKQTYKWTAKDGWDDFPSGQSMLYGEGENLIYSQEQYGVNAATTLAISITESGWGRSYMSVREYNIFGHGAFDNAPDENAASYESIGAAINSHAFNYIALNYGNPIDGWCYNGSHYGNKLSGNNVMYASDAYWGEKMASNYYSLDKNYGFQDYNRLLIGIKESAASAPVYSSATTKSVKYYDLKAAPNIPVIILGEVKGEEINGNSVWYKIQSDVPINEKRELVDLNLGTYNFDTSYAYIHSSYIVKQNKEPIISATNKEIVGGKTFNPLEGVTAYDILDGDVTSKIVVKSNKVDTNKVGVYDVTYTVTDSENNTATKTIKVTVLSSKPTISAENKTIDGGKAFNALEGVTAYDTTDGDITSKIVVKSNKVDINNAGIYDVTYSVTDSDKNTTEKTIKVTVTFGKPIISASNRDVSINSKFNPLEGVTAVDYAGKDITSSVKVKENTVDTSKAGTYKVTYSVTDDKNNNVEKTITIVVLSAKPEIVAENKTIIMYDIFDPLAGVTASDREDGNVTSKIVVKENKVDIGKAGTYKVTYSVTDSNNNTTTKTIDVTVNKSNYKETDNLYYFDSMKIVDNKLRIKGSMALVNVNNSLESNIKYTLVMTNEIDGSKIYQDIPRITDKNNMPFIIDSDPGFDYTYSWFDGEIDLTNVPYGDYSLSLVAHSNTFISSITLTNIFGAPMPNVYKTTGKEVLIRNEYETRNAPIQLFVREKILTDKTADSNYNIYNEYSTINIKNDILNIKGASHIIGGNYASDTKVTRTLVFENINTFERYTYDIGSITTGDYTIELRASDGFDKTRAWYETAINIADLPVGTYSILIATSSNVSDFGELQDIFNRKIDVTATINGKKYSFNVNTDKRYRIELKVEKN